MTPRQQAILEQLRSGRELSVEELAQQFQVSLVTIRRDLDALARQGPITRTHGGALLSRAGVIEFSFRERAQECIEQKRAIARHMAGVVRPGMTVVLDTGTTTLEVARAIAGTPRISVITSSLAIASALQAHDNLELILLGGRVRKESPDLAGSLTEDNLRLFRPGLAILGADAVDKAGTYTSDLGVAAISRAMIDGAGETWLVVDSSKFSRRALVQFADWRKFDHVVTDTGLTRKDRKWLTKAVPDVRIVET